MNKKKFLETLEVIIDRIIPLALIILIVILTIDIFFYNIAKKYHTILSVLEAIVIVIFIVDLILKYLKVRHIPKFIKKYWLDLLVVFPFFILFRVIEEILSFIRIAETIEKSQHVIHTGIEMQKEVRVLSNTEKLIPRLIRITRIMKLLPYAKRHHLIPIKL